MVVVDVDHPDIEQFIDWKVLEEQKVAALVTGSRANRAHLNAVMKASIEGNSTDPRLMISVSGIRGRVGHGLSPEVVARYAAAFGAWAIATGPSKAVVLGRDSRVSGPIFHQIARASLEAAGANVIDLGMTTTPTLQLAVEHRNVLAFLFRTSRVTPCVQASLRLHVSRQQSSTAIRILKRRGGGIPAPVMLDLHKQFIRRSAAPRTEGYGAFPVTAQQPEFTLTTH